MQDTWPAVPFREWTPVCGAVPPLAPMFRHRDVLAQGCALWAGRRTARTALGASVLSSKLPHHSQHSEDQNWQGDQFHRANQNMLPGHSSSGVGEACVELSSGRTTCPKCTFTPEQRMCWPGEGTTIAPKEWGGEKNRRCEDWVHLWAFDPILTSR